MMVRISAGSRMTAINAAGAHDEPAEPANPHTPQQGTGESLRKGAHETIIAMPAICLSLFLGPSRR